MHSNIAQRKSNALTQLLFGLSSLSGVIRKKCGHKKTLIGSKTQKIRLPWQARRVACLVALHFFKRCYAIRLMALMSASTEAVTISVWMPVPQVTLPDASCTPT